VTAVLEYIKLCLIYEGYNTAIPISGMIIILKLIDCMMYVYKTSTSQSVVKSVVAEGMKGTSEFFFVTVHVSYFLWHLAL